jgi:hypothetical protein
MERDSDVGARREKPGLWLETALEGMYSEGALHGNPRQIESSEPETREAGRRSADRPDAAVRFERLGKHSYKAPGTLAAIRD